MRLDKLFSELGILSRSEIKKELKNGKISVNDVPVKSADYRISPEHDRLCYNGTPVVYEEFVYYILNKPAGVISATEDRQCPTAMSLVPDRRKDLSLVGRLDKDTTGILLVTNDGQFLHELMSPKKHVSKTYYARIKGRVTEKEVLLFRQGLDIHDEKPTLPSELKILLSDEVSKIELTIYEGRYHQVKRMFESVGMEVLTLERLRIGGLALDPDHFPGICKKVSKSYLTDQIYQTDHSDKNLSESNLPF